MMASVTSISSSVKPLTCGFMGVTGPIATGGIDAGAFCFVVGAIGIHINVIVVDAGVLVVVVILPWVFGHAVQVAVPLRGYGWYLGLFDQGSEAL